jgi:hypothetical protein
MEQSVQPALNPVGSQQRWSVAPVQVVALSIGKMTEKFAPPQILIRRDAVSRICDVVVLVRGEELVVRCPSYSQALKWARLECKSYKISEAEIEQLGGLDHDEPDHDELPLFLRAPETSD